MVPAGRTGVAAILPRGLRAASMKKRLLSPMLSYRHQIPAALTSPGAPPRPETLRAVLLFTRTADTRSPPGWQSSTLVTIPSEFAYIDANSAWAHHTYFPHWTTGPAGPSDP